MSKPEVYARDARALLPLLETHLPASIALVGSIRCNPTLDVVATFADTPPDGEWMVVAVLPGAARQMRLFHVLEAALAGVEDEGGGVGESQLARARAMVNVVVAHLLNLHPGFKLGAVHEAWAEDLRALVGGSRNTPCTTFLAPAVYDVDVGGADTRGLVLDCGRAGDEGIIHERSGYRSLEWYAARLGDTSVLRPVSGPERGPPAGTERESRAETAPDNPPVAWVMTLPDGSVGALYTLPEYRRRGLAKAVLAHRLAHMAGWPGFCHVEVTNAASEALWTGLGWRPAHRVLWV